MSFRTEIEKLARTRRAYLRFARKENKTDRAWAGPEDRRYGKVADAQGVQVVGGDRDVRREGAFGRKVETVEVEEARTRVLQHERDPLFRP